MITFEKSLSLIKFLKKMSQFRWLGTPTRSLPSSLLELGIEQIMVQEGSWIKMTPKENFVLRIVLTIKLFFHTFCEKILISLIIMICYCSQLNKLIVFCFCKSSYILLNTISYWTYITRKDICLNPLGDLLCSLNTWRSGNRVPFFFISNLERLVFSLALQYQEKWWWCSDLCGLLHLIYLAPWILHVPVVCPYFQQFLYCRTFRFIFAPQMVAM